MALSWVTSNDINYKLDEINDFLGKKYTLDHPDKKRDWRTYEREFSHRIRTAIKDLDPIVDELIKSINILRGLGNPHSLPL